MATAIRHGTRAGYKYGCTQMTICAMPDEQGITCQEASNNYQKD